MIYERPGLPPPQNTTLGFSVAAAKFDEVVAALRSKGVADYDGAKVAWFKDTEGNIINIASR